MSVSAVTRKSRLLRVISADAAQSALRTLDLEREGLDALRTALDGGRSPLATAALRNLVALHRPLTAMHRVSPHTVPITLTLDRDVRDQFCRDLIVRALGESPTPLDVSSLAERVNALDLLGVRVGTVERHLRGLIETGFAEQVGLARRVPVCEDRDPARGRVIDVPDGDRFAVEFDQVGGER